MKTVSNSEWDSTTLKVMKLPLSGFLKNASTSTSVKVGQKVAGNELLIK